jgi:hypothetical protein
MKRNRVVVLLNDQELQHVKSLAGLVSVSAWIRAQITGKEIGAETLIPLLQKSIEKSKRVSKAASGSHSGERTQAQQAVSESPSNCSHNYGLKSCPIPMCQNYKWRDA